MSLKNEEIIFYKWLEFPPVGTKTKIAAKFEVHRTPKRHSIELRGLLPAF